MARKDLETYQKLREERLREIRENERAYQENPSLYFRRVRDFRRSVYLACSFAFILLGALAGLTYFFTVKGGGLVALVGTFFAFVLIHLIYRLCSRGPTDDFVELTRENSPKLWDLVDSIRSDLGNVSIDSIRIVPGLGAWASTRRVSRFSKKIRNDLLLGFVEFEVFDSKDMEATIAHELGHFSGLHHDPVMKLYEAQRTLHETQVAMNSTWLGSVFEPFADRLSARYEVLLEAVVQSHERDADRVCLNRVGQERFVLSRIRTYVFANRFWLLNHQISRKDPGAHWPGHEHLLELIRSEKVDVLAADLLESLREKAGTSDAHPSLADQLRAAGVEHLPASEEECADWVKAALDSIGVPAVDVFFTEQERDRLRKHFDQLAAKQFGGSGDPASEEVPLTSTTIPIDPTEAVDLTTVVTGATWKDYRARLRATEQTFGRLELNRRISELRDSPNPFHQFIAVNLAWNANKELYSTVLERLIQSPLYRHYAAALLFAHLESTDRLADAESVYTAFQEEGGIFAEVSDLFQSGPRSLDVRPPQIPQDLRDYLSGELAARKEVAAAYLVEMRPINSRHDYIPVVIIDFLSRREVFLKGDGDGRAAADQIRYEITCPFLCKDLGNYGRRWRRTVRKSVAVVLVAPRQPVREPRDPFWKKLRLSK